MHTHHNVLSSIFIAAIGLKAAQKFYEDYKKDLVSDHSQEEADRKNAEFRAREERYVKTFRIGLRAGHVICQKTEKMAFKAIHNVKAEMQNNEKSADRYAAQMNNREYTAHAPVKEDATEKADKQNAEAEPGPEPATSEDHNNGTSDVTNTVFTEKESAAETQPEKVMDNESPSEVSDQKEIASDSPDTEPESTENSGDDNNVSDVDASTDTAVLSDNTEEVEDDTPDSVNETEESESDSVVDGDKNASATQFNTNLPNDIAAQDSDESVEETTQRTDESDFMDTDAAASLFDEEKPELDETPAAEPEIKKSTVVKGIGVFNPKDRNADTNKFFQQAKTDSDHSFIISDPDGSLYRQTASYFADSGCEIRLLHFDTENDLAESATYNPLRFIFDKTGRVDNKRVNALATDFAGAMHRRRTNNLSAHSEQLFAKTYELLFQTSLLFLAEMKPVEKLTMVNLLAIAKMALANTDGKSNFDKIFAAVAKSGKQVRCLGLYKEFKRAPFDITQKAAQALVQDLEGFLSTYNMHEIVASADSAVQIDPADIIARRTVVYVIDPANTPAMKFLDDSLVVQALLS